LLGSEIGKLGPKISSCAKRRQRIAKGSGVTVTELNTMLNKFNQMQQIMKKIEKFQKMMARMGGVAANYVKKI
jgi:signal recognition particle GTPase